MNERISELAKSCMIEEYNQHGNLIEDGFDYGKFAELIIKECCDWIDGSPATDAGQLLLTKSFITANLKGHFGVEEHD